MLQFPGVLDMDRGYSIFLPNLPGDWPYVPVGPTIAEALELPVYLINDVRAFTVAELEIGAAKGVTTAICYAIGTGIGGGIVAHGRVNMGLGGAGGELGHMVVNPSGPHCGCGNRGCAEAYAAGPAIIGEANRQIVMGETTSMRAMIGDDLNKMTPEIVERAAGEGDPIARNVLDYAGFHMGLAVANAIAALAPDVVVLGGGVLKPHGYYWDQIESTARSHTHVTEIDRIVFRPAALGFEAGVVGAALWAKTEYERKAERYMSQESASGRYLVEAAAIIERVGATQLEAIDLAADICAGSIAAGGLVHAFGTGHSRIPVEELFPRHGSFPGFHPIVELSLTNHTQIVGANGQRQAMWLEKVEGFGEVILRNFNFGADDAMLIFSNSGVNAVVIDVALGAKARGMQVIAVVSFDHSSKSLVEALVWQEADRPGRYRH